MNQGSQLEEVCADCVIYLLTDSSGIGPDVHGSQPALFFVYVEESLGDINGVHNFCGHCFYRDIKIRRRRKKPPVEISDYSRST